jgi:myo-inositol-1(or 4)-monophosphatase
MDVIDNEMLIVAKQAAKDAGARIVDYRGHVIGKPKGFRDFVSEADLAAESVVLGTIRTHYPFHSILSEEGGGKDSVASEYCWIVDPLDGTKNYLWGVPISVVSIALAYKDRVCLGVVYDPWRDELFWGRAGHGAYLNDTRIHVNQHLRLADCLVATDFGYTAKRVELTAGMSKSLQGEVAGLRAFGAAALILSYVACGRLDAYFNYGLNAWDMAAGGFLVEEAGGRTTDLSGESDYLYSPGCLSTNGHIHDEVLRDWTRDGVLPLQLA